MNNESILTKLLEDYNSGSQHSQSEQPRTNNNPAPQYVMSQQPDTTQSQENTTSIPSTEPTMSAALPTPVEYVPLDPSLLNYTDFTYDFDSDQNFPYLGGPTGSMEDTLRQNAAIDDSILRGPFGELDPILAQYLPPSTLDESAELFGHASMPEHSGSNEAFGQSRPSLLGEPSTPSTALGQTVTNSSRNLQSFGSNLRPRMDRRQSFPATSSNSTAILRPPRPSQSVRMTAPTSAPQSSPLNDPQVTRRQGATSRGFCTEYQDTRQAKDQQPMLSSSLPSSVAQGKRRASDPVQDAQISSPEKRRRSSVVPTGTVSPQNQQTQLQHTDTPETEFAKMQMHSERLVEALQKYHEIEPFTAYYNLRSIMGSIDDAAMKMWGLKRRQLCIAGQDCTILPGVCYCGKLPNVPTHIPREIRRAAAPLPAPVVSGLDGLNVQQLRFVGMAREFKWDLVKASGPKHDQSGRSAKRRAEAGPNANPHLSREAEAAQQYHTYRANNPASGPDIEARPSAAPEIMRRNSQSLRRPSQTQRRPSLLSHSQSAEIPPSYLGDNGDLQAINGNKDEGVDDDPTVVPSREQERHTHQKAAQDKYNAKLRQNQHQQYIGAREDTYAEFRAHQPAEDLAERFEGFGGVGAEAQIRFPTQAAYQTEATNQQAVQVIQKEKPATDAAEEAVESPENPTSQILSRYGEHDSVDELFEFSSLSQLSVSDEGNEGSSEILLFPIDS